MNNQTAMQHQYCTVPETPEREFGPEVSNERARLVRVISKKWLNGTVLHYYFLINHQWVGQTLKMILSGKPLRNGYKLV